MLFSILIAHYNNYNYFLDCYDSIVNQTYQNFEVIIVDDYSTDGSFEKVVDLVKDDVRFKVFKNDFNRGVGYTKARCINESSGEICGFVDPDDALTPDAIEESIKCYNYNGRNIVGTHSKISVCDSHLNYIKDFDSIRAVKSNNKLFFNIGYPINHFFTFKKSVYLETNGINPKLSSAVDQDLYLKIYDKGVIKFINKNLYLYRLHGNGVSQDKTKKNRLSKNWHNVLKETLKRRQIDILYGRKIDAIENLPRFLFEKENTLLKKIKRKLFRWIYS